MMMCGGCRRAAGRECGLVYFDPFAGRQLSAHHQANLGTVVGHVHRRLVERKRARGQRVVLSEGSQLRGERKKRRDQSAYLSSSYGHHASPGSGEFHIPVGIIAERLERLTTGKL